MVSIEILDDDYDVNQSNNKEKIEVEKKQSSTTKDIPSSSSSTKTDNKPEKKNTSTSTTDNNKSSKSDNNKNNEKYNWDSNNANGSSNTKVDSNEGILGDTISNYSWSDGKKKVSVYITLDGIDTVPETNHKVTISDDCKSFIFETILGDNNKKRVLIIEPLFGEVEPNKTQIVVKKGKGMVVIKLTKKYVYEWPDLKAGGPNDKWDDIEDEFPLDDLGEEELEQLMIAAQDGGEDNDDED